MGFIMEFTSTVVSGDDENEYNKDSKISNKVLCEMYSYAVVKCRCTLLVSGLGVFVHAQLN